MVPQSVRMKLIEKMAGVCVCVCLVKQWHIQPLDKIGEKDDSGVEFNKAWEWQSLNLVIKLMH